MCLEEQINSYLESEENIKKYEAEIAQKERELSDHLQKVYPIMWMVRRCEGSCGYRSSGRWEEYCCPGTTFCDSKTAKRHVENKDPDRIMCQKVLVEDVLNKFSRITNWKKFLGKTETDILMNFHNRYKDCYEYSHVAFKPNMDYIRTTFGRMEKLKNIIRSYEKRDNKGLYSQLVNRYPIHFTMYNECNMYDKKAAEEQAAKRTSISKRKTYIYKVLTPEEYSESNLKRLVDFHKKYAETYSIN